MSEQSQRAIEHEGRIIGYVVYAYTSDDGLRIYRAWPPGEGHRRRRYDTYERCIAWLMRRSTSRTISETRAGGYTCRPAKGRRG